jgi:hypothetical protein
VAHGLDGNELLWFFTRGKTSSGRSNWREREGRWVPIIGADCTVAETRICQKVIKEKLMIPCMAVENKEKHRM